MAPPKEIVIVIYHNGHIADDPVQGSVYTCANPIFIYVSRSITLTQLIQKINNRLPTRPTKKIDQLNHVAETGESVSAIRGQWRWIVFIFEIKGVTGFVGWAHNCD